MRTQFVWCLTLENDKQNICQATHLNIKQMLDNSLIHLYRLYYFFLNTRCECKNEESANRV